MNLTSSGKAARSATSRRLGCGILLAAFVLPALPAEPYRGPIIDVHLHTSTTEDLKNIRRGFARPGAESSPLAADLAAVTQANVVSRALGVRALTDLPALDPASHFKATLAEMDRLNIRRVMLSGDDDAEAARWARHAPGRILIGTGSWDVSGARMARTAGLLDCIGEVNAQYAGLAPTDPALEPMWAYAESEDLPVAYHMHPGPPGAPFIGTNLRASLGRPLLLEDVLRKHPKLRLYVMHAGWPFVDEMIALMWDYPQVYVDVAVINWTLARAEFHGYLKRLVDAGMADRIMFGSDQMVWPEAMAKAVEGVDSAPFLTPDQKKAIFHDNAVRFFRLK